MTQVSDTIYANLDSKFIDNPDGTWSPDKAWENFIEQGNTDTTRSAIANGFKLSDREAFAVESLNAAIEAGIKDKAMTQVYSEMNKVFTAAKAKLKPQDFYKGDWNTADTLDREDAQAKYDFLFKLSSNNPQHLARFTAMALASEEVNKMLGFTARDTAAAPTNILLMIVYQ